MDESERANTIVMACGPNPMLKGVAAICAKEGVACEVSLEERMACGIGVCLCCAVTTVHDGEPKNDRCCVEGPVFQAEEVRWA
jgi:dihydroorotate dehydrogenase electron transfer subunit